MSEQALVERVTASARDVPLRELLVDVGALALLGAVLLWLPTANGGRETFVTVGTAFVGLLALPAAARSAARSGRVERAILLGYGVALAVQPLVAGYRDRLATAMLWYGLVPVVYLAARYVARSRLRVVLLVALPASAVLTWAQGIPGWFDPPVDVFAAWRTVNWHNPSGALMGALGLYALARAVRGERARVHGLVAGLCGAGLWLSGSRGAISISLAIAVVLLARQVRSRRALGTAVAVVAGAVALVAALTAVAPAAGDPTDGGRTITGPGTADVQRDEQGNVVRTGTATGNLRARLLHVEAALGMFASEPLTGTGLGSYPRMAIDFADPGMNFTSSAHSQPAEVLGEGGLLFGIPFLAGYVGAGLLLAAALWRRRTRAIEAGAAGAALVILGHSLMDLDWFFPLLPLLAAVFAGVALAERAPPEPRPARAGRWGTAAIAVLLGAVLATGLVVHVRGAAAKAADEIPDWESEQHAQAAVDALLDGRLQDARTATERARQASPGDDDLAVLERTVEAVASGDEAALPAVLDDTDQTPRAAAFALAGLVVLDPEQALVVADRLEERLEAYHPVLIGRTADEVERLRDEAERRAPP